MRYDWQQAADMECTRRHGCMHERVQRNTVKPTRSACLLCSPVLVDALPLRHQVVWV